MTGPLYFAEMYVVTMEVGCPEEGDPLHDDFVSIHRTFKGAEAAAERVRGKLYQRNVITDGRIAVDLNDPEVQFMQVQE